MKPSTLLGAIFIVISTFAGCTHSVRAPEFNQTYLPDATPGSPQKRIDLPQQVINKVRITGRSDSYLPISLYWIDGDRLLFNVYGGDYSDTLLRSFLIVPSTSEIRELEGDERQALVSAMEKSSRVVKADTWLDGIAELGKVVVGLAVGIVTRGGGSGGSFKNKYAGSIEHNGTVLSIDISSESRSHWGGPFASEYYKCDYLVKNVTTGTIFKANRVIEEDDVEYKLKDKTLVYELKDWLRTWRVSPDARHYLIGKTATLVDPDTGMSTSLIEDYKDAYAGIDVNPNWDQIALLKKDQDKETKQAKYWIEFYRFKAR